MQGSLQRRFIVAGGRYECEELTTGHASLTTVHEIDGEEQDVAIEICPNGPEVPGKVDALVRHSLAWLENSARVRNLGAVIGR